MSALAVLLIIGSAVVGPIEAQTSIEVIHCRSREDCQRMQRENIDTRHTESLPELCERAIKEAGIQTVLKFGPSKEYPNGLITTETLQGKDTPPVPPQDSWFAWPPATTGIFTVGDYWSDKYRVTVRCIPVPTGYKAR